MKKLNKKHKKLIMDQYFSEEELNDSQKGSRKAVLDWIQEANHFFFKARGPAAWKRDGEIMEKIGW